MKFNDIVAYAIKSLQHSQLRTWLTVLGIVIGICSVIVLVSIGEGLNQSINEQLAQFGPKTVIVIPVSLSSSGGGGMSMGGMPVAGKLFLKDIEEIKKLSSVDIISPLITQRTGVTFKGKQITASISGIDPDVAEQISKDVVDVEEGRWLIASDRGSVVLGNDMALKSFGKDKVGVNSVLLIQNKTFRVVGILKKSGNTFSATDSAIYVNYQDAQSLFSSVMEDKEITAIRLTVKDDADVEEVGIEIEDKLRNLHRVKEGEEDFGVITPAFINNTVGNITSMLTLFLGAIAAISLIVGGVGIMNTMFMAVVERTKEIGILKAIGANQMEILSIFLVESGVIGMLGGAIGIASALVLLEIAKQFSVPVFTSWYVVVGAFLFSFMVGVISGFVPSRNAARISPLEALRYE